MKNDLKLFVLLTLTFIAAAGVQVASGQTRTLIQGKDSSNIVRDARVDTSGNVTVNTAAFTSGAYGETLVSNVTPTLIGGLSGRQSIAVQNRGPNPIFCGTSSAVTTTTGWKLYTDDVMVLGISDAIPVYCIASVAEQLTGAGTNRIEVK